MNKFVRIIVSSLFLCFSSVYADIELISVSSSGEQGDSNSGPENVPGKSVSADGRFVAFSSEASNLVDGDTNGNTDIFVHDRETGQTQRVSISSSGDQANDRSISPSLSADGRYVAFSSGASNLVTGDTNDVFDVFIHDRQTGLTQRVSVSSSGEQGTRLSSGANLSANGRYVAFESRASNLVGGDTNGTQDIFVHDRQMGLTQLVSVSSSGMQVTQAPFRPSLSADGRYVAFATRAPLVAEDTNFFRDIYVHDRDTGLTQRVSVSSSGEQANAEFAFYALSADGRYVAFESSASNLVAGDTNATTDIFVHDRNTGMTQRVSVSSRGEQGNGTSFSINLSLSADGRYVAFSSSASNLVEGDTNGSYDVFVHDQETGVTQRASVSSSGVQGDNASLGASLSADGRYVAFESMASNLVAGDANGFTDVFITENTLVNSDNDLVTVEKSINNESRQTSETAAQLAVGTLYRQSYKVTNNSPNRIYQVKVFENGNLVCNFFALNSGQSRQRCISYQTVLEGDQHMQPMVSAKVSGSGEVITNKTDTYYTGLTNVTGELRVTHRINNINADNAGQAPTLSSQQASVSFKIENTGEIELYQVKTYHDPVSPVNSGWDLQCVLGPMKPGQVRHCKRDITLTESGLNQAMGRVQGRNAIRSATDVVNASNPTYFIAP